MASAPTIHEKASTSQTAAAAYSKLALSANVAVQNAASKVACSEVRSIAQPAS